LPKVWDRIDAQTDFTRKTSWVFGTCRRSGQVALDLSMATSSPWAMHVGNSGHIINPVTGAPPNFTTLRVIHDSAAMADGLSTGLVFATDQLLQSCIDAPMGPKSIIGRRTSGEIVRFG